MLSGFLPSAVEGSAFDTGREERRLAAAACYDAVVYSQLRSSMR
jgi:hypothetical protein